MAKLIHFDIVLHQLKEHLNIIFFDSLKVLTVLYLPIILWSVLLS